MIRNSSSLLLEINLTPYIESFCSLDDDICDGACPYRTDVNCCYDDDSDGFGDPGNGRCVQYLQDCDDANALVNPSMNESCYTPFDDNCNGAKNEYCPTSSPIFKKQIKTMMT